MSVGNGVDAAERVVPAGYVAVELDPSQRDAPLRCCALFRPERDDEAGRLVHLRDLLTGHSILGCLIDHAGFVHEWLEVRIQDPTALAETPIGATGVLSNAAVDEAWRQDADASLETSVGACVDTPWARDAPAPTFIDPTDPCCAPATDAGSGQPLEVCRDEALLAARGLSPYGTTLHRYLYVPDQGAESPFVPVGESTLRTKDTTELADVVQRTDLVPLNPAGGLMQIRKFSAIGVEAYVDVLGGASWSGVMDAAEQLPVGLALRGLAQSTMVQRLGEGHLLLTRGGQSGRLVEVLHLKLRLLADAFRAVSEHVRLTQRPLLNVSPQSFQLRMGDPACGLPYLWTTRLVLADLGAAVPLPIEGSDLEYFLRGSTHGASIYQPASGRLPTRGQALVRLRRVQDEADDSIIAEGTFETSESVETTEGDLVWLRLPTAAGPANLYVTCDAEQAVATAEYRFRSVARRFSEAYRAAVRSLEGVPLEQVSFEVVPLLTSPCDLYSLGVLSVRTLLTDDTQTLPEAIDQVLSLARQCASEFDEAVPLVDRIAAIVHQDERWLESLGPQRAIREEVASNAAWSLLPPALWLQTLAMMVRLFPAIGPDSHCRGLGDAPAGGMHRVFEAPLREIEDLLVRSRSLIVVDWAANREIHAVVRRFATGVGATVLSDQ